MRTRHSPVLGLVNTRSILVAHDELLSDIALKISSLSNASKATLRQFPPANGMKWIWGFASGVFSAILRNRFTTSRSVKRGQRKLIVLIEVCCTLTLGLRRKMSQTLVPKVPAWYGPVRFQTSAT